MGAKREMSRLISSSKGPLSLSLTRHTHYGGGLGMARLGDAQREGLACHGATPHPEGKESGRANAPRPRCRSLTSTRGTHHS